MPDWFSRLRNVVWTAVGSAAAAIAAVVTALAGADARIVQALAAAGVSLAVLSTRQ